MNLRRLHYVALFEQIWNDEEKLKDVTGGADHIAAVYQENSPARIYFLMLYNIFTEFLEDISEDVLPNDRPAIRTASSGRSCTTSSAMRPPASSTSWRPTTAASSPIASAWERHSPHSPSSSTTSFATAPSSCSAPRSSPTTGSITTET